MSLASSRAMQCGAIREAPCRQQPFGPNADVQPLSLGTGCKFGFSGVKLECVHIPRGDSGCALCLRLAAPFPARWHPDGPEVPLGTGQDTRFPLRLVDGGCHVSQQLQWPRLLHAGEVPLSGGFAAACAALLPLGQFQLNNWNRFEAEEETIFACFCLDEPPSSSCSRFAHLHPTAKSGTVPSLQDDRCNCFKAPLKIALQRGGWTGFDCSQRMCPFGTAFGALSTAKQGLLGDSGGRIHLIKASPASKNVLAIARPLRYGLDQDINVEVEIVEVAGVAEGKLRFRVQGDDGDMEQLHVFSAATSKLVSAATGLEIVIRKLEHLMRSGILVYVDSSQVTQQSDMTPGDLYFFNFTFNSGGSYRVGHHNSMHQPMECSGVGKCNYLTGTCRCPLGFGGASCSKLQCPRRCSGHGACVTQKTFLKDAGVDYSNAYDANKVLTCSCDPGYRGPDCSERECPSGTDPLGGPGGAEGRPCSGRGLCDTMSGLCQCFPGFFGIRCETMTAFV